MNAIIVNLLLLLFTSCAVKPTNINENDIKQGVEGRVLWMEGNLMPTTDKPNAAIKGKPIERQIFIYKLVNVMDTETDGRFFTKIKGKLVKKVQSDAQGKFKAQLPVGEYSLLVKEEKGWYANLFDGDNNVNPVVVNKNKITKIDINVDYKAVY